MKGKEEESPSSTIPKISSRIDEIDQDNSSIQLFTTQFTRIVVLFEGTNTQIFLIQK